MKSHACYTASVRRLLPLFALACAVEPVTSQSELAGEYRITRVADFGTPMPDASGNFEWFASGSYRRNGTNDLEYRMGSEVLLSAGARMRAGAQWEPSLQLNLRDAGRDRFLGEDVPSTGSQLWNLTPGLRYRRDNWGSLYAFLQIPVHQDVNEAQLAPRYGVVLGATF